MYIVRWKRTADGQLAQVWLDAPDRMAIIAAVDEIDRTLANDPHAASESRSGSMRVMFVPPLGIFFEVDESHKLVEVLKVWTY